MQARQVALQGRESGRVGVYARVGSKPQWSRLEMHGRRPLNRFVGREQELATLRDRVRQVEAGWGQLVGMIADPGIGKSRLCYELVRGALAPPWFTLETRGSAYGQSTPYQPIIDLLKSSFRLDDHADPPTIHDQISAKLIASVRPLHPLCRPSWRFLTYQWKTPNGRRLRRPNGASVLWTPSSACCSGRVSGSHCCWIDDETQALLDHLVDSLPIAHVLLLITYRPEYRHGWGHKTYYT